MSDLGAQGGRANRPAVPPGMCLDMAICDSDDASAIVVRRREVEESAGSAAGQVNDESGRAEVLRSHVLKEERRDRRHDV